MSEERIVNYTRKNLPEGDATDWERLRSMTEAEIDDPEKSGRQCYVSQQLKIADAPGGSNPKIEWIEKILSN